ncbi:MAG: lysophospholipase [Alphaproteobacteria bacterium]|nr:lysophospholipase [Alphaproteobacteria bacterium]
MSHEVFITASGIKLAYIAKPARGAKIGVIIAHGITEHKGRYKEFIARLHDAGISVFAADLRGHGESGGRPGDIESFDDYTRDLDQFARHISNKYPGLKIALFGHSLGGLVTCAYAEQNNNAADLIILSSPSLKMPGIMRIIGLCPAYLRRRIYIKKFWSESAEMLDYARCDPHTTNHVTLNLVYSSFINGVRRVVKNYGNIKLPVLMLGGRLDPLVNSGRLESIMNKFGSTDKTILMYDNARHRIVQNAAADIAIPDIINWLKAHSI